MLKYYRQEKNETSEVPTDVWFSYFKNLNEKKTSSENIKEQLIDTSINKTYLFVCLYLTLHLPTL
jgi:hypothetical protein